MKKEITIKQFGYDNDDREWIMLDNGTVYFKDGNKWFNGGNPLEDLKAYLASEGKEL